MAQTVKHLPAMRETRVQFLGQEDPLAKMIGIAELSEKAKSLEMAAKSNEENYILENHDSMIRDYGRITGDIRDQLLSEEKDSDDDVFEFEPESDGGDKV